MKILISGNWFNALNYYDSVLQESEGISDIYAQRSEYYGIILLRISFNMTATKRMIYNHQGVSAVDNKTHLFHIFSINKVVMDIKLDKY
jgi:hypothetical protein